MGKAECTVEKRAAEKRRPDADGNAKAVIPFALRQDGKNRKGRKAGQAACIPFSTVAAAQVPWDSIFFDEELIDWAGIHAALAKGQVAVVRGVDSDDLYFWKNEAHRMLGLLNVDVHLDENGCLYIMPRGVALGLCQCGGHRHKYEGGLLLK